MKDAISYRRIATPIWTSIFSFVTIFALGQPVPAPGCVFLLDFALPSDTSTAASAMPPVIVFGFVGGFVKHDDPVHDEVRLAARLRKAYPSGVDMETFENSHGESARKKILSPAGHRS